MKVVREGRRKRLNDVILGRDPGERSILALPNPSSRFSGERIFVSPVNLNVLAMPYRSIAHPSVAVVWSY